MEVKEMLAEKRVKRTAVDMSKLKADGLMVAAAYMQGLQAAVRLCEQQQQVSASRAEIETSPAPSVGAGRRCALNSSTDKDLKRIMGAIRCDTLEEKAKKKERAEAIERAEKRYETAMRFLKQRRQ